MKKYALMLALCLVCHNLMAGIVTHNFESVDDLMAAVKQDDPTRLLYDTNGIITGAHLPIACCTDHNLQLLSHVKSIRYLLVCGSFISTNGILALAEYPNLTGLGIVCGGNPRKNLTSALPRLTHLQSLELMQNAYQPNDSIYLAKMTNLVALEIAGFIPQTKAELSCLTNLVHLRRLLIFGNEETIKNVDASIVSKFDNLTTFVISSELDLPEKEPVWKTPAEE